MDFSLLSEALTSKSYEKVADICDEHMLQVAAEGVAFQEDWPYAIHLLGHIYAEFDLSGGKYAVIVCGFFGNQCLPLSKRAIQKSLLLGKLARSCGCETMGGVYEAIRGYDWSQEAQGLVAAFSGKFF
ncbi:unnamed protein product [Prunus armeniaca]|uniref:Uncharacterized protein n=1 Tax=Prunus armeniaca TaxID=36596 RepID=A0A6J5TGZ0_PRUAR|nr:unnamed protein product [Prunus armeniaca]